MCEYALRKHSESTGRVPRRLCPSMYVMHIRMHILSRWAAAGGSRDGTPSGSARPGRVRGGSGSLGLSSGRTLLYREGFEASPSPAPERRA